MNRPMTQFGLMWWTGVWIRLDLLKVKNRIKRKCSTDFKNVLDFHILYKHKMNTNVMNKDIWRLAYICMYKSDQDLHFMTCNYRYELELKHSKWGINSLIAWNFEFSLSFFWIDQCKWIFPGTIKINLKSSINKVAERS